MSHPLDTHAIYMCDGCGEWHYKNEVRPTCADWSAEDRALIYLNREPSPASCVGEYVFTRPGKRKSRGFSAGGGGDFAAQMLLGRMRVAGLVRTQQTEGCSIWELTSKGIEAAKRVPT